MDTGGRHTHLLVDPGFPREAWHPSSAPEKMVTDRRVCKAAKHAPPTFHAPPSRRMPLSATGHTGAAESLARLRIQALWICMPEADPQLGRQLPGSLSNSKSEEESSAIEPPGWVWPRWEPWAAVPRPVTRVSQPGGCQGVSGRQVGLGTFLLETLAGAASAWFLVSFFARWAGGPGHPDL